MPNKTLNTSAAVNDLDLTYTLDNEFVYPRSEVVGIHSLFAPDSVAPADIYQCYFEKGELRQLIGYGAVYFNQATNVKFETTLFEAATAGTLRVEYQDDSGAMRTLFDDGVGGFTDPDGLLVAGTINYGTGAISIEFNYIYRPKAFSQSTTGAPVYAYWTSPTAASYPAQWNVTRTWGDGSVKQAKAWIGQEDGTPFAIPAAQAIDVYVASLAFPGLVLQLSSAGNYVATAWDGGTESQLVLFSSQELAAMNSSGEPIYRLYGENRVTVIKKQGTDTSYNTANLPVYSVQSDLATQLSSASSMQSSVTDTQAQSYSVLMWDSRYHEEILENPTFNTNQGWMKVTQHRSYHDDFRFSAHQADRDLFSATYYSYVPHNSRQAQVELRIANDYMGSDPHAHQFTQAAVSPAGSALSVDLTHAHNGSFSESTPSLADLPSIRRCGVELLNSEGVTVATDHYGDGNLVAVGEDKRPIYSRARSAATNPVELYGTVDYETGSVTINENSPSVANIRYYSYVQMVGTVTGTNPSSQVFDSLPQGTHASQYSLRVRVGKSSILADAWDAGGQRNSQTGYLAPMSADVSVADTQISAAPLAATVAFNLGQTNIHPGSLMLHADEQGGSERFSASRNSTWSDSSRWAHDNGNGGRGKSNNVASLTVDYAAGTGSITFSGTPESDWNLYATFRASNSTPNISGSFDRDAGASSHGQLTLNLQGTFSSDPVYISYFPNALRDQASGEYHDPNVHTLGNAPLARWNVRVNSGLNLFMEGTDPESQANYWGAGNTGGAQLNYYSSTGSRNLYQVWAEGNTSLTGYRILDDRFDSQSAEIGNSGRYSALVEGSSLYRNFSIYANASASATDDLNWKGRMYGQIHGVPTAHSQKQTNALTVFEASTQQVSPKTASLTGYKKDMFGASFEELSLTNRYGAMANSNAFAVLNRNSSVENYRMAPSEERMHFDWFWQDGKGDGYGDSSGNSNFRNNLNWFENDNKLEESDLSKAATWVAQNILFTGSSSSLRYLSNASQWSLIRPGSSVWGSTDSHSYSNDLFRSGSNKGRYGSISNANIHPANVSGLEKVGDINSKASLRGRGKGRSYGFFGAYNGSSNSAANIRIVEGTSGATARVFWNMPAGGTVPGTNDTFEFSSDAYGDGTNLVGIRFPSIDSDTGAWTTFRGDAKAEYLARFTIQGSNQYHEITAATYNSAGGYTELTLSPAYSANPKFSSGLSSPLSFNPTSDYRTGEDQKWVRNDPRTFPSLRNGLYTDGTQSGIEAPRYDNPSNFAGYDVWNLTGEWGVWDQVRMSADWAMTKLKDFHLEGSDIVDHYDPSQREFAHTLRLVVQGLDAVNYLQDKTGFSCLTDFGSGLKSRDRYKDFILGRMRSAMDNGSTGGMDPEGNVATGSRSRIHNLSIESDKSENSWNDMSRLGTSSLPLGDATYTEAELTYGSGFKSISIVDQGMSSPFIGAAMRLLENEPGTLTFNNRGDLAGSSTLSKELAYNYWDSHSRMMIDYGFLDRAGSAVQKGLTGFAGVSRSGTSITVQPVSSGSSRFNSFPEEIAGPNSGVRGALPLAKSGFSTYQVGTGTPLVNDSVVIPVSPNLTATNFAAAIPLIAYDAARNPSNYGLTSGQSVSFEGTTWSLSEANLLGTVYHSPFSPSNFPSKVFNRHYLASQVSELRGSPRSVSATIQHPTDGIGYPILNAKGELVSAYGNDNTFTAKDGQSSDDTVNNPTDWPPTAWHYAGESGFTATQSAATPAQGSSPRDFIGGSEMSSVGQLEFNSIGSNEEPTTRPPMHGEGSNVEGTLSVAVERDLDISSFTGLPMINYHHRDSKIAARAGDFLNRLLYNGIVAAHIAPNRSFSGNINVLMLETASVGAGLTGGWPYRDDPESTINNLSTDRWSKSGFSVRREISTSKAILGVTTQDIFTLDFSAIGIPSYEILDKISNQDAVVVVQDADGTNTVCESVLVDPNGTASGEDYIMYVKFPEDISETPVVLGSNPANRRWYLYTRSSLGPFASWNNSNNVEAPLSTVTSTVLHLDNSANDGLPTLWQDISGNNASAVSTFGSASAATGRANPGFTLTPTALGVGNGLVSAGGAALASASSPMGLGNRFTIDLSYKATVADFIALHNKGSEATTRRYTLTSLQKNDGDNQPTFSFISYLENQTGSLKVVYNGATDSSWSLSAGSTLCTNSAGMVFGGLQYILTVPTNTSNVIWFGSDGGEISAKYDHSTTTITNYGTVNVTGVNWSVSTNPTIDIDNTLSGSDVFAIYQLSDGSSTPDNTVVPEQWTNIRVSHSGSQLRLSLNNNNLGGVFTSVPLTTFGLTGQELFVVGAEHTQTGGFSNAARGSVSELRVVKSDVGTPIVTDSTISSAVSTKSAESLETITTESLAIEGQIKEPETSQLDIEGIIAITITSSLGVNGNVAFFNTSDLTVESAVATLEDSNITVDGSVQIEVSESITVEGLVYQAFDHNLDIEGTLATQETENLSLEGTLAIPQDSSLVVVGSVTENKTKSLSLQGEVVIPRSESLSIEGQLQTSQSELLNVRGSISFERSASLTIESEVRDPAAPATLTGGGTVAVPGTETLTAEGLLNLVKDESLTMTGDIAVEATIASLVCSGRIATRQSSNPLTARGSVQVSGNLQGIMIYGLMIRPGTDTLDAEASVQTSQSSLLSAGGSIQIDQSQSLTANGSIQVNDNLLSLEVDASVQTGQNEVLDVESYVLAPIQLASLAFEGTIAVQNSETLNLGGSLATNQTNALSAEGYLQGAEGLMAERLTCNANIQRSGSFEDLIINATIKVPSKANLYCLGYVTRNPNLSPSTTTPLTPGK